MYDSIINTASILILNAELFFNKLTLILDFPFEIKTASTEKLRFPKISFCLFLNLFLFIYLLE